MSEATPATLTQNAAAEVATIVTGNRARPTLPANLAQPCAPLAPLQTDSWDALAQAYIGLVLDYGECTARHRAVVDAYGSIL